MFEPPMSDTAAARPRANAPELTVSELSASLKRTLEDAFGYVRVRGELGNVKYHSSGHPISTSRTTRPASPA
jgi:exodeoxyribonuclease VII large subunit